MLCFLGLLLLAFAKILFSSSAFGRLMTYALVIRAPWRISANFFIVAFILAIFTGISCVTVPGEVTFLVTVVAFYILSPISTRTSPTIGSD